MKISIQRSVDYQLGQMTQKDVDKYCGIVGIDPMSPEEFKEWFEDYSEDGLAQLLFVRADLERD